MTKVRARKWRYGRFLPHTGCPVAASPIRKSQPHLCAVSAQGSQLLVVGFRLCQGHADLNLLAIQHSGKPIWSRISLLKPFLKDPWSSQHVGYKEKGKSRYHRTTKKKLVRLMWWGRKETRMLFSGTG